jgi:glycosyltransferase involved in cell wall biosynthesis
LPTIGWIGRFELEAMALAKPVIAYVSDELYAKYRPPVHRTTPETLKQDLEYLIEDSDYREQLAKSGLLYATKYHSPESITVQLDNWYKKLS